MVWGGAVLGVTNTWLGGGKTYDDYVTGAMWGVVGTMGGAAIGAAIGPAVGAMASAATKGISSAVLQGAAAGAIQGAVLGFGAGFGLAYLQTGKLGVSLKAGALGMVIGAGVGAVAGGSQAARIQSNAQRDGSYQQIDDQTWWPEPQEEYYGQTDSDLMHSNSDAQVIKQDVDGKYQVNDGRIQIDRIEIEGWKNNWEISNMTQEEVMSKLTDLTFYKQAGDATIYTTPGGGYLTKYPSSYYKGSDVPTLMYNNGSGKIIHLRFIGH